MAMSSGVWSRKGGYPPPHPPRGNDHKRKISQVRRMWKTYLENDLSGKKDLENIFWKVFAEHAQSPLKRAGGFGRGNPREAQS